MDLMEKERELDKRASDIFHIVETYGSHVIMDIMHLNKTQVLSSIGGHLSADLSNLKEYLQVLHDVIKQGCTNTSSLNWSINGVMVQKLQQLEGTPGPADQ